MLTADERLEDVTATATWRTVVIWAGTDQHNIWVKADDYVSWLQS